MNITLEKRDGTTLLHFHEERLDAHNSPNLKEYLLRQLENDPNRLIADLSEVRFIDSSGLGAFLSGYKNASLRHNSLALAGLQPRVQSMFELTRLHRVFEIYPTIEEALGGNVGETPHEPDRN